MIFTVKKNLENLRGDALCHKLTIILQTIFNIYEFINTLSIKNRKKKPTEKAEKNELLAFLCIKTVRPPPPPPPISPGLYRFYMTALLFFFPNLQDII